MKNSLYILYVMTHCLAVLMQKEQNFLMKINKANYHEASGFNKMLM